MNNFDRNTRTLIVSFLIAIFALIPLRFVEVGTQQSLMSQTSVLGETVVNVPEERIAEVKLEAPYDELEMCISEVEVKTMEDEVVDQLQNKDLSEEEMTVMLDELRKVEANVCQ